MLGFSLIVYGDHCMRENLAAAARHPNQSLQVLVSRHFLSPTIRDLRLASLIWSTEALKAVAEKTEKLLSECNGCGRALMAPNVRYHDSIPECYSSTV